MTTPTELKSLSRQQLSALARQLDIAGRSGMTKEQLVAAVEQAQLASAKRSRRAASAQPDANGKAPVKATVKKMANTSEKAAVKGKASTKGKAKPAAQSRAGTQSRAGIQSRAAAKTTAKTASNKSTGDQPAAKPAVKAKPTVGKSAAKSPSTPATKSPAAKKRGAGKPAAVPAVPPVSAKSKRIREEMRRRSEAAMQNKDLSTSVLVAGESIRGLGGKQVSATAKDRIVLLVRDSYWLQADWEITRGAVQRVRAAMNEKWHKAVPVLRLMSVGDASVNRAEQLIRDIPVHGGVNTWFIDVENSPARFRVVIGYLAENERFYPLLRSNIVATPKPDGVHRLDRHWNDIAEDYERIYSLSGGHEPGSSADLREAFEERLQRQMPVRSDDGITHDTDAALDRYRSLPFDVNAELIVYGSTVPGASVTLSGDPVKLRDDGTFTVRVAMPDKRQVLPVIVQSRDGMRQRTTVIAVERNTKVMEVVDRDQNF